MRRNNNNHLLFLFHILLFLLSHASVCVTGYSSNLIGYSFGSKKSPLCSVVPRQMTCMSMSSTRRSFVFGATGCLLFAPAAKAIGPVKVALLNPVYSAKPCPKDKPIPGEKAMKGLRGMCVTVTAELEEAPPKNLEKVGVYGFITDAETGDSVLANNPDLSTDAGQFSMIDSVTTKDSKITFEFVAAVPMEKDLTVYPNGIGNLNFEGLRIISYPGGQQYGAISPCEMNEFSAECEAWEQINGPYSKGEYMMKSNVRTKGY